MLAAVLHETIPREACSAFVDLHLDLSKVKVDRSKATAVDLDLDKANADLARGRPWAASESSFAVRRNLRKLRPLPF